MQFALEFPISIPVELAVFKTAQSAMSTVILAKANEFDLSRLSLISFSCQVKATPKQSTILANCSFVQGEASNAGRHHVIRIELTEDQNPFARAEFEIIDRKRGLKSSVLRNLWAPNSRILTNFESKSVALEDIFAEFPGLCGIKIEEEKWPLEALLAAAIKNKRVSQGANFEVNFLIYGSAICKMPCEVRVSQSLTADPDLVEIIQENVLIAQVN